ncbi:hypothetical protein [Microbacterium sp.]|uniref:hypothetical protein n=1 Tax=Microbacterium sp. TaxID=51671 RepID=UPI0039E5BD45
MIVLDSANPLAHSDVYAGVDAEQPLAVLPPRTSVDKVLAVVDAFVQAFIWRDADDRTRFLTPVNPRKPETAYGRAERHSWGQQVMGGVNPYIEAFQVDDLQVVTDPETGASRFEYTRRPVQRPSFLDRGDD